MKCVVSLVHAKRHLPRYLQVLEPDGKPRIPLEEEANHNFLEVVRGPWKGNAIWNFLNHYDWNGEGERLDSDHRGQSAVAIPSALDVPIPAVAPANSETGAQAEAQLQPATRSWGWFGRSSIPSADLEGAAVRENSQGAAEEDQEKAQMAEVIGDLQRQIAEVRNQMRRSTPNII